MEKKKKKRTHKRKGEEGRDGKAEKGDGVRRRGNGQGEEMRGRQEKGRRVYKDKM